MVFYNCPKCQYVWQYPLNICPECFSQIKRDRSKKLRVVAISKTVIPSIFHPTPPYYVLLLENEKGDRFCQKSLKRYKIGKSFKFEIKKKRTAVAILKMKYDFLEGIENIIELLGSLSLIKRAKILILLTLVSPQHSYFMENTRSQFLKAVIEYLFKKGFKKENITTVGQAINSYTFEKAAKKSKILSVCQKYKIKLLDLKKEKISFVRRKKFVFKVPDQIKKADLIINLPTLKLDKEIKIRGGLCNLIRILKKEDWQKARELLGKEQALLMLSKIFKNCLTIIDASKIKKPDGDIIFPNLILASFNPLNLDRVAAEIFNVRLTNLLKSVNLKKIPITGREIKEVQI